MRWCACSPGNHPSQVHAYIQIQVFGPKSGLICKNRSCVWCVLGVSSVFLGDARVVRSHGVVSRGPGSAKTRTFGIAQGWIGIPRYDEKIGQGKVPTPGYVRQSSEKCLRRPPCPAGLVLVVNSLQGSFLRVQKNTGNPPNPRR